MSKHSDAKRPAWAHRLDRAGLWVTRLSGLILPPPDERKLTALARKHRSAPEPMDFRPADYGVEDHLSRGREALTRGDLGEALHHFGLRVREVPSDPWGWHGRGDALQLMDQSVEALDAYDHAVGLDPEFGLHHGGRANALESLDRTSEADAAWSRALELDPSLSWMRRDRL